MGSQLAQVSAAARDVFARADRALGWSVSNLCFEGPERELTLTAHAQPAILTTSLAALAALRERYPELVPAFAAGHSLGEYSALVAAGALSLEDAVRLVHTRGQAMQSAVPEGQGGMAAVMGGDAELVAELCRQAAQGEVLSPANHNAPGQIVVAGHVGAVGRLVEQAAAHKLRAVLLKVSAPFHCALMRPAAIVLERALGKIRFSAASFPVMSNVEASANREASRWPELLVRQVDGPVLWEQSIRRLVELGAARALEIGPGQVLAGLVKRIDKTLRVLSIGEPDALGKVAEFVA
jgi:[acyl-carrier-protein] S-malonyltransferase